MNNKKIIIDKIKILDVGISQVTPNKILEIIENAINNNVKGYVTVTGAHGIIESHKSEYIKKIHNLSFMSIPDGLPNVWISKLKGSNSISQCRGADIMDKILCMSNNKKITHYFYGGNDGVAEQLKENFIKKYSEIKIVGTFCPPFRPLTIYEDKNITKIIEELSPDIFWVGLSTPKQEIFMYEYIGKLNVKIMIGVGAAFDFHIGKVKEAPVILRKIGLEWLYRLFTEPKRLWKRYFEIVPKYLIFNLIDLFKVKNN